MEKTILHLKRYLREFHGPDLKSDVPLFYAKTRGQMHELSSDSLEKMIKRYAEKCRSKGLPMPNNVHCHMVRKTRAMDLYREGVPLTHIQQMLGHENISTTSGFYAFATLETLSTAMKKAGTESESAEKRWMDEATLEKLYSL